MTGGAAVPAARPPERVGQDERVTLSYGPPLHLMVWLAAALPIALGIAMAILVPQDEPDAPIVPIVLGAFTVGAIPLAFWWSVVRGVQYVLDAEGIKKTRWRRATVPWNAVTDIQLIRPYGRWIVVRAPGGVYFGTGSKPVSELRLPASYLQVRNTDLLQLLRQRWAAGRRAGPG